MDEDTRYTLVENSHYLHKIYKINGTPYVLPEYTMGDLDRIKSFKIRDDDVFVITFPKSGTTVVNEIVSLILNNGDVETLQSKLYEERSQYLEFKKPGIDFLNDMKSPRLIKTHLGVKLLPDGFEKRAKVIYCMRNPKDVLVSFYHFMQTRKECDYSGSFEDMVTEFMNETQPWGPWWTHVDEYVQLPGIHLMYFEDFIKNPYDTVKALFEFLGKNADDEIIKKIMNWCSFKNMKSNPNINYNWRNGFKENTTFFRKGEIGDWLNLFSSEMSEKFDNFIKDRLKSNLRFDYGVELDENKN